MKYEIKNEQITVEVNTKGANLESIRDASGFEYLWQGDKRYWEDKSLTLFPYIARMTGRSYQLEGKTYQMDIHGFVKDMELEAEQKSQEKICFSLEDSPQTREQYPYRFRYEAEYVLKGKTLSVTFRVWNLDEKKMYFAVGGHPGFNIPMEEGRAFTDYFLEFSREAKPRRIEFSPDCFVTGIGGEYALEEGKRIPLRHDLFDQDAIVLKDMCREAAIRCPGGKRGIKVSYPQMDYLGIWHMPHTDAPYVCIEPWSSLPSRKDVVEDLAHQDNLLCLQPGAHYENCWEITIENEN